MTDAGRVYSLREYERVCLRREELTAEEGESLWEKHRSRIAIEFPSPKTGGKWELCSLGWAGYLPVTRELGFRLQPKIELGNIFRMLEYAYRLKSFEFLSGLMSCRSMEELYENLAHVLARRVLDRARRGLHREYLAHEDRLSFLRGRLDLQRSIRMPWDVKLDCSFQEHTADIEDNQILAWTLSRILRTAACQREEVLGSVRNALRILQGVATPTPVAPHTCVDRVYSRLNEDYRPLHALCRFFLEQSGPTQELGDGRTLPFLVDMAKLFELFVAEWLRAQIPSDLEVRVQESVPIARKLDFTIDLVIYRKSSPGALSVIDTKYKAPRTPSSEDVQQAIAYAKAKGCREAVLVYPAPLERPLQAQVGEIRIRSLAFDLRQDLEEAGKSFLGELLNHLSP